MIHFFWLAWIAWRRAGRNGTHYAALATLGVPHTAIFVATGREAWRVCDMAIQAHRVRSEEFPERQQTDKASAH